MLFKHQKSKRISFGKKCWQLIIFLSREKTFINKCKKNKAMVNAIKGIKKKK